MTNPGGMRATGWRTTPLGMVSVAVLRGYDCRKRCEHVPPRPNKGGDNHGQHCDEWLFELRIGDAAAALQCYSWIRNGKVEDLRRHHLRRVRRAPGVFDYETYRELAIYGARLVEHRKCEPGFSNPDAEKCPLFGFCVSDFAGFLNSASFFTEEHCAALLPLARHPVDDIDLPAVVDAMRPLWAKLVGFIAAKGD